MYLRKSQKGFSLPEVLIATALMGAGAVVTLKVMDEQHQNEAYIKANAEINKTLSVIQNHINNKENCEFMLGGKTRFAGLDPSIPNGSVAELFIPNRRNAAQTISVLAQNRKYQEFFIPSGGIQLAQSKYGPSISELIINFHIKKKGIFAKLGSSQDQIVRRSLPFVSDLNGNIIRSCGPVVADANTASMKKMCDGFSSTGITQWNFSTSRCEITNLPQCNYPMVPSSMTTFGNWTCVNIDTRLDPSKIFDMNPKDCRGMQIGVRLVGTGPAARLKVDCW